jgi:small nuclear ribonucleoprotein (snRNP)-like protein
MTVAVLVLCYGLVLVLVAALVALAYVTWRRSTVAGLLAERARRHVIVTLKTGAAFRGVLYATDREALVLRDAQALAYGAQRTNVPVEGEALLLRSDVDYLQVLPAAVAP